MLYTCIYFLCFAFIILSTYILVCTRAVDIQGDKGVLYFPKYLTDVLQFKCLHNHEIWFCVGFHFYANECRKLMMLM